jgi:hypothetical protein
MVHSMLLLLSVVVAAVDGGILRFQAGKEERRVAKDAN